MKHAKGNCSMMEVRQIADNRWIIGHSSNGAIIYYAKDKADAEKVLKEWIAAPEMLETLNKIVERLKRKEITMTLELTEGQILQFAIDAINKATE